MAIYSHNRKCIFYTVVMVFALIGSGCSTSSYGKKPSPLAQTSYSRPRVTESDRLRIAAIAKKALGKPRLIVGNKPFRGDCSGTVRAIFAHARISLGGILKSHHENDVKAIYRYVRKYGSIKKSNPGPGDLVFFHNTYDRSRNGRMNDALTHIGIVEKVEGSTVHFIHHLGHSIIRSRMDLARPKDRVDPRNHKRINDVLRRAQGQHRAYTAGELFAGFGRL